MKKINELKLSTRKKYLSNYRSWLNLNEQVLRRPVVHPEELEIRITSRGLRINNKLYTKKEFIKEFVNNKPQTIGFKLKQVLIKKIRELEANIYKTTKNKHYKYDFLGEMGRGLLDYGIDIMTEEEYNAFLDWLDSNDGGSDGSNKNLYYRKLGFASDDIQTATVFWKTMFFKDSNHPLTKLAKKRGK